MNLVPSLTTERIHTRSPGTLQHHSVYHIQISKCIPLQHWDHQNLTHIEDWNEIDLTSLKRTRNMTTVHMVHFITKFMSNTFSTMIIL